MIDLPPKGYEGPTAPEIINPDNIRFLDRHAARYRNGDFDKMADGDRTAAARLYHKLRKPHRIHPGPIVEGKIKWEYPEKSEVHKLRDKGMGPLLGKSPPECMAIFKAKIGKIGNAE